MPDGRGAHGRVPFRKCSAEPRISSWRFFGIQRTPHGLNATTDCLSHPRFRTEPHGSRYRVQRGSWISTQRPYLSNARHRFVSYDAVQHLGDKATEHDVCQGSSSFSKYPKKDLGRTGGEQGGHCRHQRQLDSLLEHANRCEGRETAWGTGVAV